MMLSFYINQTSALFWQENNVEKLHSFIDFIPVLFDAITLLF